MCSPGPFELRALCVVLTFLSNPYIHPNLLNELRLVNQDFSIKFELEQGLWLSWSTKTEDCNAKKLDSVEGAFTERNSHSVQCDSIKFWIWPLKCTVLIIISIQVQTSVARLEYRLWQGNVKVTKMKIGQVCICLLPNVHSAQSSKRNLQYSD